jgi:hypothetical protein
MQGRMGVCQSLMDQKEAFSIIRDTFDKIFSSKAVGNKSSRIVFIYLL